MRIFGICKKVKLTTAVFRISLINFPVLEYVELFTYIVIDSKFHLFYISRISVRR